MIGSRTKLLKLQGTGAYVTVKSTTHAIGEDLRVLEAGAIIRVYVTPVGEFYELSDGSVIHYNTTQIVTNYIVHF